MAIGVRLIFCQKKLFFPWSTKKLWKNIPKFYFQEWKIVQNCTLLFWEKLSRLGKGSKICLLLTNPPTPQVWKKIHVVFLGFLAHLEKNWSFDLDNLSTSSICGLILIIESHGGSLECKRGWKPFFGGFQLLLADIRIRILLSSYCQFYTLREVTKKIRPGLTPPKKGKKKKLV